MLEYWNCIEESCTSRFIRRGYLYKHLTGRKHKYSKEDARRKALAAHRGDIDIASQYYEDISEDYSVFGLIAGVEVENTNYGGRFDIDDYLDENANARADDKQIHVDTVSIHDDIPKEDNIQKPCDDIQYEDISDADIEDDVQDSCGNQGNTVSDKECEDLCDEQTIHSDNDVIIVSDDEANSETAVEISTSTFKTQTLVLTLTKTVQLINGQEVATNVSCKQDFYEYL
jgi:hypothetical protein